jgi:uncharacterized cupin superfamily protein
VAESAAVDLDPEPIPSDWILSGTPVATAKRLSRSRDWTSNLVVWECTAGRFNWHYNKDETLVVVSGSAVIKDDDGKERRFGPGDVVYFPAGSSSEWRIDDRIRKVAIVRETLWWPFGMCLKIWNKLLRLVGIGGNSPLMLAFGLWAAAKIAPSFF